MILGVVTSMTLTPPGRDLLARTVSRVSRPHRHCGQVEVGAISGSFLYDLTLENLVVRDTSGELLADLPRVRVGYRLPNLIAGPGGAELPCSWSVPPSSSSSTATAG